MRKFAAVAVSVGLIASLSACVSTPAGATCGSTGNAALVTADGPLGGDPAATFPVPLKSTTTSIALTTVGDGVRVPSDGVIEGTISLYDGQTGDPLVDGSSQQPLVGIDLLLPTSPGYRLPYTELLDCATVGSRVTVEGALGDLLGADLADGLGLDPESSLVIVTDVSDAYLGRANGADQIAESGLPAVVLAPNGQPGFTFPDGDGPTEQRVVLLKRGSGATLDAGQTAVVHYSAVEWGASAVSTSTWTAMVPAKVILDGADATQFTFAGTVKDALVGQTVGSQVLVVVPGDKAVVYVVDILGVSAE